MMTDVANFFQFAKKASALTLILLLDAQALFAQGELTNRRKYSCEWILIAQYAGHVGTDANFKVKGVLKGPPVNLVLPVNFDFPSHDSTESKKKHLQRFPKIDSTWIIFIPVIVRSCHNRSYELLDVNEGLLKGSKETLTRTIEGIERFNPTFHFTKDERLNLEKASTND